MYECTYYYCTDEFTYFHCMYGITYRLAVSYVLKSYVS